MRYKRFLSIAAAGLLLLSLADRAPTLARGSQGGHDDLWNTERINHLPPEVRNCPHPHVWQSG
jgi:hypothetical protein